MNETPHTTKPAAQPRTWSQWERKLKPPAYAMQPRDIKILEAVFRHRFLTVSHIHALLGSSKSRLSLRCRVLWQDGYLERPKALRPTRVLTEEIVYALGKKGAQLLEQLRRKGEPLLDYLAPTVHIGELDWAESPKKQIGWPYIDHQLGIATFMVAMQAAANARSVQFHWDGHFNRQQHRITTPGDGINFLPDAYFTLEVPAKGIAHHYLELDRGSVSLKRMQERYNRYFQFWKSGYGKGRTFKHFRVLTVTHDPDYMQSLRRIALPIGRDNHHNSTWKALMFTHTGTFNLQEPENIFSPIWLYADDDATVSLF
ncbi:MAG: hypothetical protein D4R93_03345 [Deltaproteobacteria bacterium]|nr:MAG: hypothetical protein D4R93_03345 [Deltaproteobacteria bacterium]